MRPVVGGQARPGARTRHRRRALASGAALGAVLASVAWGVTDHLEQRNDFCTACHLEPDEPLHLAVRRDFDVLPPVSLAGAHGAAELETRDDGSFRCIDCHRGTGPVGRARVKVLAAKDAFWYVTGHFEEPQGMRWPLWDEDCSKCHASFDESEAEPWATPRFHHLAVHNVELGVSCVECHLVHESGGRPDAWFLRTDHVRRQCARCHPEFEEGGG